MAQTSLIIGDTNWAVKEDSLLGYNVIQNKYLPIPIDCVRATTATRVNEQGLIEIVPRNLLTYSEQFNNADWLKTNSPTITTDIAIAPNGTLTADGIKADDAINFKTITQGKTVVVNSTVTYSIFVKKETSETFFGGFNVYFTGGTAKICYVIVNAVNGTATISSNTITPIVSVIDFGTYWRICCTATDNGSNTLVTVGYYATLSTNGISVNAGIGTTRTIWGAQLEESLTATEYFPTTNRLDIPRIDYSTGTASLLVEPQRTNLFFYSQELENPYWLKAAIAGAAEPVITANDTISPNGNMDADKVVFSPITVLGQSSILYRPFTATNTSYSQSFYIKGLLGTEVIWIEYTKDGVSFISKICNLTTNWQRFSLSSLLTAGTDNVVIGVDTRDPSQTLRPAQTVFIWGAQFEVGSYPTSYIPTIASTVTRNADVISKTGISSLIGQTEGVIYSEFIFTSGITIGRIIGGISEASLSNRLILNLANVNKIQIIGRANGITFFNISSTIALINGKNKIAIAYKSGDLCLFINGVLANTSTDTFTFNQSVNQVFPFVSEIDGSPATQVFGQLFQLYKTRLSNTELTQLTTL
jgi:hypothetical protein